MAALQKDCKAHPDEKGIETRTWGALSSIGPQDCKAHPDEKGIETIEGHFGIHAVGKSYCKAHPDEKGIETYKSFRRCRPLPLHCKAHPDEKGIETAPLTGLGSFSIELQSSSRRKGN